ncbi:GLUG motif-containing protein, partial [Klebsiella pneumoniae]|uniref:GLUG motif-containing protein n=1 Tax=Klebsiella pneumoniae TaxID=573 RepID=UPI00351D9263
MSGNHSVGGLAGRSAGEITSCHAASVVTGTGHGVGGLVGDNEGTISSSYAVGPVTGEDF